MKTLLTYITAQERQICFEDCLQFTLVRDRYQPFAVFHARMRANQLSSMPEEPAVEVRFSIDGVQVFQGLVKNLEYMHEQNQWVLKLTAHSFTAALTKNQLVPGIHNEVTLKGLMETYQLPNVTYETGMVEINYIFVKSNAAMWDSIIAYNYKLNRGYPYIRVPNKLCVLPHIGKIEAKITADRILRYAERSDTGEMISRIDMADATGEYGKFSGINFEAAKRKIVRVRQTLLDKQYLYDPGDALQFRIDIGNRRMRSKSVSYLGYCSEDIEDLVEVESLLTARVSRIVVSGDAKGIVTTDTFYFDPFCNTDAA